MRRSTALILIFVIVILVGVPVFFGTLGWVRITEPYRGFRVRNSSSTFLPGRSTAEIGRRLAEAGVVPDQLTFRAAVWQAGAERA